MYSAYFKWKLQNNWYLFYLLSSYLIKVVGIIFSYWENDGYATNRTCRTYLILLHFKQSMVDLNKNILQIMIG